MAKPELVVSTGSFYPTSTSDSLSRIARLGFNQAEVYVQNSELDYNFYRQDNLQYFERLRDLVAKLGVRVTSLHAPFVSGVQAFSFRARNEILLRCLDIAGLLQGDELVVHPYHVFRSYEEACLFLSEESVRIEALTLPEFPTTLKRARELGLTIAMENIAHWHDDAFLNDPNNMLRFVSAVDSIEVDLDVFHSEYGHTRRPF